MSKTTKQLILVRHGESFANAGVKGGTLPMYNAELTSLGLQQAVEAASYVLDRYPVDEILTSPFTRCIQTAEAIASLTHKKITLEPLLHEYFSQNLFGDMRLLRFPDLRELSKHYSFISGTYPTTKWWPSIHELEQDVSDRASRLLDILLNPYNPAQHIVCVGHWASIAALVYNLDCNVFMPVVNNASVTTFSIKEGLVQSEKINHYAFQEISTPS